MVLITLSCIKPILSQNDFHYFIIQNDSLQYELVYGTSFPIKMDENACYEYVDEKYIVEGEKFIILNIRDEMENDRGVIIFDKNKGQVNYQAVQTERKKYYKFYKCCVYVKELNGKLYFWDFIYPFENEEDYDCSLDAQNDIPLQIPRYYIFDTETGGVETISLSGNCEKLIEDGEIICDE